jgi:hypothetical protein
MKNSTYICNMKNMNTVKTAAAIVMTIATMAMISCGTITTESTSPATASKVDSTVVKGDTTKTTVKVDSTKVKTK